MQLHTANRMSRVLELITSAIDRDMPITVLLTFLCVAAAGDQGIDQGELQNHLKASSSGLSRTLQTLGERHYLKEREGLRLVERIIDPNDNRRRLVRLATRGRSLMEKISAELARC